MYQFDLIRLPDVGVGEFYSRFVYVLKTIGNKITSFILTLLNESKKVFSGECLE